MMHTFISYLTGWYRINEAILLDKQYWMQRRCQVCWRKHYYVKNHPPMFAPWIERQLDRYHGFDRREQANHLNLEIWELRPGAEQSWYTKAMLEAEATERVKLQKPNFEVKGTYTFDDIWEEARKELTKKELPDVRILGWKLSGINDYIFSFSTPTKEEQKIEYELEQLNKLAAAKPVYDAVVGQLTTELRAIMRELATPAGRVEESSGIQEVVMGHGIQLSSAEMEARISNQLVSLPMSRFEKFALVKIAENIPQNPGKKCVSCGVVNNPGVLYCVQCQTRIIGANEYTIKTIKPPDVNTQLLEQRVKRLLANNIRGGYVRERATVEAEITQRQTSCSGSAPIQTQPQQLSPQLQPRHARQVPVQGKCSNCGKSILPGSTFCNQCGMKLT